MNRAFIYERFVGSEYYSCSWLMRLFGSLEVLQNKQLIGLGERECSSFCLISFIWTKRKASLARQAHNSFCFYKYHQEKIQLIGVETIEAGTDLFSSYIAEYISVCYLYQ